MHWYFEVIRKYAVFDGRARRAEYWLYTLVNFLVMVMLVGIDVTSGHFDADIGFGPLSGIYALAVLVPGLAVGARRLHDTNHSAAWLFLSVVPFLGGIVLLYFMVLEGEPGDNRFGPDPKAVHCISCGATVPQGTEFCPGCGVRQLV